MIARTALVGPCSIAIVDWPRTASFGFRWIVSAWNFATPLEELVCWTLNQSSAYAVYILVVLPQQSAITQAHNGLRHSRVFLFINHHRHRNCSSDFACGSVHRVTQSWLYQRPADRVNPNPYSLGTPRPRPCLAGDVLHGNGLTAWCLVRVRVVVAAARTLPRYAWASPATVSRPASYSRLSEVWNHDMFARFVWMDASLSDLKPDPYVGTGVALVACFQTRSFFPIFYGTCFPKTWNMIQKESDKANEENISENSRKHKDENW